MTSNAENAALPRADSFDERTKVPIGVAVSAALGIAGFLFFAYQYFENRERTYLEKVETSQQATDAKIGSLQVEVQVLQRTVEKIEDRAQDRFTGTQMDIWTLKLKNMNPDLQVPDPRGVPPRVSVPFGAEPNTSNR